MLLALWVGIILFSSTDVAGAWANDLYRWLLVTAAESRSGPLYWIAQKSFHIILFAVFGWLLASQCQPRSSWLRGVMGSFAMGAVSEGMQFLFASRHPASADFLLNGLAGSLFFWLRIR